MNECEKGSPETGGIAPGVDGARRPAAPPQRAPAPPPHAHTHRHRARV